jgi:hypothetical protein
MLCNKDGDVAGDVATALPVGKLPLDFFRGCDVVAGETVGFPSGPAGSATLTATTQPILRFSVTSFGHIDQPKAMLRSWQHLAGVVCPKAVATVAMAIRAKGNRGSDYAITRGRGEN